MEGVSLQSVKNGVQRYKEATRRVNDHCVHHMHIRKEDIQKLYMERWKSNNLEEKDDRDNKAFLELELEGELWEIPPSEIPNGEEAYGGA